MKRILVVVLIVFNLNLFAQTTGTICDRAELLVAMINKNHHEPVVLNDNVSEEIFDLFVEYLDYYHLYFTKADIEKLAFYKKELDAPGNPKVCEFVKLSVEVFQKKFQKIDTLVEKLLSAPIDLTKPDSLIFNELTKAQFAVDEKALEKRWKRLIKYKMLDQLFSSEEEGADPFVLSDAKILESEAKVRTVLKTREKRHFKRILNYPGGIESYVHYLFLNAYSTRFDPHTMYFTNSGKEQFERHLSKEALSFGISFNENDKGEIEISDLVPGGGAWRSNKLNTRDVLLKIKWSSGKIVDVATMSVDELDDVMEASSDKKAEFTVKKSNGSVVTVWIAKQKIEVDENVVTGYILKGKETIGYIALPDFYTDFDNVQALGCANDVAKEILKLQKENIKGLILDLRFNGGGSLYETMNLAGIFINEGPLFMDRTKKQKPFVYRDRNRGTIYNGPLLVLVNGQSASASEVLAGTLQDYNRAIIAGSKTYGKATFQAVLPVDTTLDMKAPSHSKASSTNDFVKLTLGKIYRVTGESHQKQGVIPDVEIPEIMDEHEPQEADSKYALAKDTVTKKVTYTRLPPIAIDKLKQKTALRKDGDTRIKKLTFIRDSISKHKTRSVSLQLAKYRKQELAQLKLENRLDTLFAKRTVEYKASGSQFDQSLINSNELRKEMYDAVIEKMETDYTLEQAFLILNDFLNFEKK